LSERGYEVSLAVDGVLGLRQAFLNKPDLILLNLILPAGTGEAVVANLRKAGIAPTYMGPEAFGPFMRAEHEKWGKVVKQTGATIN